MTQDASPTGPWHHTAGLPPAAFATLRKPDLAINPISIVATVDSVGAPHVAPFGSLRAVTPKLLRLACMRRHATYTNLLRDNRLMIAFVAPPDIAVSISGWARVVRERMISDPDMALIEVDVEAVKNDLTFRASIASGIAVSIPRGNIGWYLALIRELEVEDGRDCAELPGIS